MSDNPLLPLLDGLHVLPLDRVVPGQIAEAVDAGIAQARARVDAIVACPDAPTFANTVEALEAADEGLDRVTSVFYHLLHVESDEALQALSREIPPKLSAFANDVTLNRDLFRRFEEVEARQAELDLTPEQATVLDDHLTSFRRNGASLSMEDQETLRSIDQELSICSPQFSEHVLKATQAFSLWVTDPLQVEGIPEAAVAAARAAAEAEERPGDWKFTLDAPSYLAFMTFAPDAALRERMWRAYGSRCLEGEYQNRDLIQRLLDLRYRRARLLGYRDHAHYTLERRMAGNLETLQAFYDRLLPVVMPAAQRDVEAVRVLKEEETGEMDLYPWDFSFYSERLRQRNFDLRQEELRPWFAFDATLDMLFELARRLFGLKVDPDPGLPVQREEVRTYRLTRESDGGDIGSLLIDPFPRATKRPGAWMSGLLGQGRWDGQVRRPTVAIVANLTPPTDGSPSLLTLDEARTMFHEFGHALHELLSQCTYRSVAGTHVRWDFVELPSQLMENWLLEEDFLREFPRHVETGEPIPDALIERIQAARTFQKGYQSARQVGFGLLDLAWYTTPPESVGGDLEAFEREATAATRLFPPEDGIAMSPSFQHIFSGGYAAGYYSYKWAEVLEADVFEVFLENGLFDTQTASRLEETILSRGGSRPPQDLFRDFRGRDPDPDALLRRDGLLA